MYSQSQNSRFMCLSLTLFSGLNLVNKTTCIKSIQIILLEKIFLGYGLILVQYKHFTGSVNCLPRNVD